MDARRGTIFGAVLDFSQLENQFNLANLQDRQDSLDPDARPRGPVSFLLFFNQIVN